MSKVALITGIFRGTIATNSLLRQEQLKSYQLPKSTILLYTLRRSYRVGVCIAALRSYCNATIKCISKS